MVLTTGPAGVPQCVLLVREVAVVLLECQPIRLHDIEDDVPMSRNNSRKTAGKQLACLEGARLVYE